MCGDRLAELRKDKGLTQQEFADLMSLSKSAISSYERNLTTPDDDTKVRFARFFNVSLDYMMGAKDCQEALDAPRNHILLLQLPDKAQNELTSFIESLKRKYKL